MEAALGKMPERKPIEKLNVVRNFRQVIEARDISLIGNPSHHLGFMVASSDDPLGYEDPAEALSVLETLREDFGNHLKLYRAIPVESPVATRHELEKYHNENGLEEHCPSLVDEYLL